MISSRALVKTLYDYWPLVEALTIQSKEAPFLDRYTVESLALLHHGQNRLEADEAVRQLLGKGVLAEAGNREEYQIHGAVRDFVLSLSQEQELGLADSIRAEVEEIRRLGMEIQNCLSKGDLSALQEQVSKLGVRLQAISRQLLHDQQAILNIADRAKSLPPGTPLSERYREVLESFDRYVEPMVRLLQQDEQGFATLTEQIEDQLIQAEELCLQIGALVSWRRKIYSTARYLRTLRDHARESLSLCRETLLPLREEYLKNSGLAIAVARLLAIARKKGMAAAVPEGRLGLGGASRNQRVVPGRFTKAYMADLMDFRPETVAFPEAPEGPPQMQPRLRFETVLSDLAREETDTPLLPWLLKHYPEQEEKELLRLYHLLLRSSPGPIGQSDTEEIQPMTRHTLRYYPHTLQVHT